jgi:hypothetical protein
LAAEQVFEAFAAVAEVRPAKAPIARPPRIAGLILSFGIIRLVLFGLILLLFIRGRGNRAANVLVVGLTVAFGNCYSTWLPQWTIVPIELVWAPVKAIGVIARPASRSRFQATMSMRRKQGSCSVSAPPLVSPKAHSS